MPGPITKSEMNALATLVRNPKARASVEESTVATLTQRGLVREKLGKLEATPRGKITIQRSARLQRGRGTPSSSHGPID